MLHCPEMNAATNGTSKFSQPFIKLFLRPCVYMPRYHFPGNLLSGWPCCAWAASLINIPRLCVCRSMAFFSAIEPYLIRRYVVCKETKAIISLSIYLQVIFLWERLQRTREQKVHVECWVECTASERECQVPNPCLALTYVCYVRSLASPRQSSASPITARWHTSFLHWVESCSTFNTNPMTLHCSNFLGGCWKMHPETATGESPFPRACWAPLLLWSFDMEIGNHLTQG